MTEKLKKSLIGWTEKNWFMGWNNETNDGRISWTMDWDSLDFTEITKQKKAYTIRKNPIKVRITIEEI